MKTDIMRSFYDDAAKRIMEREKELEKNPLSEYSTSQLKAELKRRKEERYGK